MKAWRAMFLLAIGLIAYASLQVMNSPGIAAAEWKSDKRFLELTSSIACKPDTQTNSLKQKLYYLLKESGKFQDFMKYGFRKYGYCPNQQLAILEMNIEFMDWAYDISFPAAYFFKFEVLHKEYVTEKNLGKVCNVLSRHDADLRATVHIAHAQPAGDNVFLIFGIETINCRLLYRQLESQKY